MPAPVHVCAHRTARIGGSSHSAVTAGMCCALFLALPAAALAFTVGLLAPRSSAGMAGALAKSLGGAGNALGGQQSALAASGAGGLLAALAAGAALSLVALYRFATADADLALLLRGRHKPGAFRGKVVWITGASQGLGEVIATYLAAQGARLILSSRSREKLQAVKDAAGPEASERIVILPFDLLDSADKLAAAAQAADAAFGGAGIDFLVHNAGGSQHALASETSDAVARQLLELNALAPIRLTQAALPYMLKRGKGRLVVIASLAAKVPSPGQAVYSGAKMAVWGYFASLAAEVADTGVGVTIVCPGPVATGAPGKPRVVFGPAGPITRTEVPDAKRMAPARAAALVADAMAAGVSEAWLAKQPVLTVAYVMQFLPALGWAFMKKIGPGRARALHAGKSGYSLSGFVGDRSGAQ